MQAKAYLDRLECDAVVVIPGNHDSRNVGYVHFEELFGARNPVVQRERRHDRRGRLDRAGPRPRPDRPRPLLAGSRSSSPRATPTCGSSSCTTTCCPCRAPVASATSSTTRATRSSACSVRGRPRPVRPQARPLRVAAREPVRRSTPARSRSQRLRGRTRPCYNLIEITDRHVDVWRKYPFHGQERIIQFSTETRCVREVHRRESRAR